MLSSHRIKAQGLPLNTIIIAALGLIVLIIVIMLVQTQITKTSKGIRNASEAQCSPPNEVKSIGTDCEVIYGSFSDVQTGLQICCKQGTVR